MHATTHEHAEAVHETPPTTTSPLESFRTPPAAGTVGTWLFTAGLTLAFVFLLIGYAVTRTRSTLPGPTIPIWFWFSTFVLLVSSVFLHWAYLSAQMHRTRTAVRALFTSTMLGMVFILLQTPGLIELIHMHQDTQALTGLGNAGGTGSAAPYLFILFLVALHGVHTLAGLGRMVVLNRYLRRDDTAYRVAHLKQMCLFWHFLAVAWVVMFGVILGT